VLQSLDDDNNPDNGIFIDDNTKGYLTEEINIIDVNISKFETIVKNAQKRFVSQRKSREHYIKTLKSMSINPEVVPFITVWETTSDDENITIPIDSNYTYNYTVDWGDGTIIKNINNNITHTYSSIGKHKVKISGKFPAIKTSSEKLQTITQWGDIAWSSFKDAFSNCSNLDVNTTDTPALSDVHSISGMFSNASNLKGNKYFNNWDVSSVTDMSFMFSDTEAFNQPLNNWNVSNVTSMSSMFSGTKVFNQALDKWNVSKVTSMIFMFTDAKDFNQPLNNWDVSSVTNMDSMFEEATNFNQPLNNWNVSNVTSMSSMFSDAEAFNQALNNWNVSSVTSMSWMFRGASAFKNQDLSTWNVKSGVGHLNFMGGSGGENTEPNWN
jgi:surface protein